jgi:hypothetical protein
MARGWESKSVEEQQQMVQESREEAHAQPATVSKDELDRLKAEKTRKVQALKLTEARVREQLERCTNPRYAEMLNLELSHIETELQSLK